MDRLVKNEHFVPEDGRSIEDYLERREKLPIHHLIRYQWAKAVIDGLGLAGRLLDVACGAGYGAFALAERFPRLEVIGADYDEDAIAFARRNYIAPNLEFTKVDVTRWRESLANLQFNCIVSFDTIEHVEHREIMMQNVVEALCSDGTLLLSTPIRPDTVLLPGWKHHKVEYSAPALYDFLRRYFQKVVAPDRDTFPCRGIFDAINRDDPIYSLKMNPVMCREPIRIMMGK